MRSRALEGGVMATTLLSAALLVLMLVAPALPWPTSTAATDPTPSPEASPSDAPAEAVPPTGLFALREAFSFGPCLALELTPLSYPTSDGAEGSATVHWWTRGMTGCDARSGEVRTASARVSAVRDEDDPAAGPVAYEVRFAISPDGDPDAPPPPTVQAAITILAGQSTDTLLQAVETSPGSGQGLVLDRVDAVEPPLNPLPSG